MTSTYAVLLPTDEDAWLAAPEGHRQAVYAQHEKFAAALAERGHTIVAGAELTHSRGALQVRHVDGALTVTEGPYAESVEQLSGFYLIESDDLDDLVACAGILAEADDDVVEIRKTGSV